MIIFGQRSSSEWRKQQELQEKRARKIAKSEEFKARQKLWAEERSAILTTRPTRESVRKLKDKCLLDNMGYKKGTW